MLATLLGKYHQNMGVLRFQTPPYNHLFSDITLQPLSPSGPISVVGRGDSNFRVSSGLVRSFTLASSEICCNQAYIFVNNSNRSGPSAP